MKKVVKVLAILVAILMTVIVVGGLVQRSNWSVERSVVVNAKPAHITPFVASPAEWQKWAAWNNDMDPEAKNVFFGPASGAGAAWAWQGPKLGQGLLRITEVTDSHVAYEMMMEGKLTLDGEHTKMEGGSPAKGRFSFAAEADATRVTWLDEGDMGNNPIAAWFVPMIEKMLGEHFQKGLDKLKVVAEEAAAAQPETPVADQAEPTAEPAEVAAPAPQ